MTDIEMETPPHSERKRRKENNDEGNMSKRKKEEEGGGKKKEEKWKTIRRPLDFRFFVSTNARHNSGLLPSLCVNGEGWKRAGKYFRTRVRVAGASVARTRVPICDSYVEISDT